MPIGDVRIITACQLIFVTILSHMVVGESCGFIETFSVLVTLVGMTLVTHPPFLFGQPEGSDAITYDTVYFTAAGFALIGAFFQAVGYVSMNELKALDFSIPMLWSSLGGLLPITIITWFTGGFVNLPSPMQFLIVFATGVLGFCSQVTTTVAMQVGEPGILSLVRKACDILLAYALQIFYFQEVPGVIAIVGALLIVFAVLFAGTAKIIKSRRTIVA